MQVTGVQLMCTYDYTWLYSYQKQQNDCSSYILKVEMRRQGYSINIIEATKKMKENRIETEEQISLSDAHGDVTERPIS